MRLLALSLLLSASLAPTALRAQEVTSVPALDLSRYAGEWHEIARLPMYFQRQCRSEITAQYTLREDGLVGVRNRCKTDDGTFDAGSNTYHYNWKTSSTYVNRCFDLLLELDNGTTQTARFKFTK